jgi:hypothetical protein
LPPQGFAPRGPEPEEAYIEVPARNMISTVYTSEAEKFKFLSFLPAKHWCMGNIAKNNGGIEVPAKHKLLKLSRLEATEYEYLYSKRPQSDRSLKAEGSNFIIKASELLA